ncbi:DUF475 domain-containing protein [bacterium]|nr:MAG: DUF475 domain-containing protein [bacterium]
MSSASAQLNIFRFSIGAVILALILGWWVGGPQQALVVAILAILEISLSFENAVINASILRKMSDFWQEMFLTVGLLIAVVGMRLLFPVVIVMVTSGLALGSVVDLVLNHPEEYAQQLEAAHLSIAAFGGMFLFMIFIDFLLDATKKVHWIETIEKPLARAGSLKLLPTLVGLVVLVGLAYGLSEHDTAVVLESGLIGLITYLVVRGASRLFEQLGGVGQLAQTGKAAVKLTGRAAFASFVYLEVIDASFSFDGVVGAFALTNNVIVIALGLGVGAMFIRELTVWLVRHNTLTQLKYLEHGAYYAVGSLAVLLWAGLYVELPEAVTGLAGAVIIVASIIESIQERRALKAH